MLLDHLGRALAARRWTEGRALGALVLAARWADLLWPLLVFAGVERVAIESGLTAFSALDLAHTSRGVTASSRWRSGER